MSQINKFWTYLEQRSFLQLGAIIFCISFLVRLALIFSFHTFSDLARFELERTAISLATTGIYGNPYAVPSGPTAHVSPGYTLILSAIFRVFGTGIAAEIVKQIWACVVTSVGYALLPAVAQAFGLDRSVGLTAGLISALYPAKLLVQIDGDWETPYTALFLTALSIATAVLWRDRQLSVKCGIRYGLLWGVALLFASVLLPVFGVMLLVGIYFCWRQRSNYVVFAAAQIGAVALCLAPWAIRNYYALGKPILSRSNLGIEMRVSNNDQASPDQRDNSLRGVYDRYHPLQNVGEARIVARLGEVKYNQIALAQAQQWIQTHPRRYLELTAGRALAFWFYNDRGSKLKTLFLDTTGLLGLMGAGWLLWTRPLPGMVSAIPLLLYPAPNYVIHVGARQRFPIDWLLTLLSVALVLAVCKRLMSRHVPGAVMASNQARDVTERV